jgi:uncharacterized protein (DUF362 family)
LPPLNILLIRIVALFFFGSVVSALAQNVRPTPTPSVVYAAYDSAAIDHYRTDPVVVHEMVDRLILAVTRQSDIAKAWSSLVSPTDKVGIKISAVGGELFTTHRDVVNAIVDGLVAAGHPRASIIVWDRQLGGIKDAGYRARDEGYRLISISPRDGYDAKAVFSAPLMGKLIWGDLEYRSDKGKMPLLSDTENTSNLSHFCHILSSEVTKIINVPVMSDSTTNGLAGCLYNVTIPNVDNWRRFSDSSAFGASSIAEIYSDPLIAKKVVLNVMDGLIAEYAGGPQSEPNYALHYATLMASKDPVAIDAVALKQIETWRKNAKVPPIGNAAAYLQIAGQMGLGNADPGRIEVKAVNP